MVAFATGRASQTSPPSPVGARKGVRAARCLRPAVEGVDYQDLETDLGVNYRLYLVVLAMGGRNSMDIVQAVHEYILIEGDCLLQVECIRHRHGDLVGDTWEGTYCDDHFVL